MCCYVGNTDCGQYGPVGEQQKTEVATPVPLGNVAAAPVVVQGQEVRVVNGKVTVMHASTEYSNLNMLRL